MLLKPDIKLNGITNINIDILNKCGIKALLLDVDNTMSTHHGTVLTDGLLEWIAKMQENGIKLSVLSNSKEWRIKPFTERIGLDFISSGAKPLPFGYLKGAKSLSLKCKNIAIVGDQIFTDVLGGNLVGMKTILLTPIKLEDYWGFRLKRWLERFVYKIHKIKDENE